ncbi:MAG: hypothetical protein ABIF11_06085 [Nitrospirota bacterium]
MEIKKRLCTECHTKMDPRLISMFYEEKGTVFSIEVVGILANVCPKCNFRLIPGVVARYIDTIVDTLFESSKQQEEKLIPTPRITIWFPSQSEMAKVA